MTRQNISTKTRRGKHKGNNHDESMMTTLRSAIFGLLHAGGIFKLLALCCFTLSLLPFQGRYLADQNASSSSSSTVESSLLPPKSLPPRARKQGILRTSKGGGSTGIAAAAHFTAILSTDNTTILAQAPYHTMQSFLHQYPDTSGSRFIRHLQEQLHGRPEWEPHRQSACERTLPLCLGGYHNTISKTSTISTSPRYATSLDRIYNFYSTQEKDCYLPLLPQDPNSTNVYRLRRYRDTEHVVHNLGTHKACLPLMLAAFSIDYDRGMVLELGPFTGFSSKCLAYGILAAARKQNGTKIDNTVPRLLAFDTFDGEVNYRTISKNAPWVQKVYPTYRNGNASFVNLWSGTVQYVYPEAQAIAGHINTTVLNDDIVKERWNPLSPQVLIVDTVKTAKLLHDHLGGLTLSAGTVLFLMDFQRSKEVVQQIYGCFRQEYLLPVYISWNNEHVAFVVTRTFTVNDPEILQCYQQLSQVDFAKNPYHKKVMEARVKQDLVFLSGLTTDPDVHERFREGLRDRTMQAMLKILDEQDEWTWRVLAGGMKDRLPKPLSIGMR